MPLRPVNVFMPDFQVVKTREFPESVRQISWNGDEKQVLLSVIVEGGNDIVLLAPDGEQKQILSGHAEPVSTHDWVSPDSVASVSADGEVRVWTVRGSRVDCVRIKDKYPRPRGIVAIPSVKKSDARFLLWYQDAALQVFEAGKPAGVSKELPGKVLGISALENALLILHDDQGSTKLLVLDMHLAEKQSIAIALDDLPVQVTGFRVDASTYGCILLGAGGRLVSCTTKDGKVHALDKNEEISAFHVENDTRTVFLGMKSGMVHAVAFRPDLSFIDSIATFEAHEFKITSIALIKKLLLLAIGGLDGILKLARIADSFLQKSKQPAEKPGADWKERERVENKIRQAEDAIDKGEMSRAAELLDAVRHAPIPDLDARVGQAEAHLRAKSGEQQKSQATRQKLIDFLDHVAEERGEILLGEISKALSMSMADVKRWIKALDAEMEWEYIEQHECLILFDRTASIARVTDIERQISRDDGSFPGRGQRRQLGRGREFERRPYHPAQQRQPVRQQGPPPRFRGMAPAIQANEGDFKILKQVAAGISGKMQASILGSDLKILKTVSLPDLIPVMESISQPTRAIVTDGIISPRLAAIAEKAGVKYIVGQRFHPNLDKSATKVDCLELHELESRSFSPPPSTGMQGTREAPAMSHSDLEGRLLAVISTIKWQSIDEILASAGITDEFERNLATIKLKQLVASGTLASEVINNIPFFLHVKQ
jgi:hypothetical protein